MLRQSHPRCGEMAPHLIFPYSRLIFLWISLLFDYFATFYPTFYLLSFSLPSAIYPSVFASSLHLFLLTSHFLRFSFSPLYLPLSSLPLPSLLLFHPFFSIVSQANFAKRIERAKIMGRRGMGGGEPECHGNHGCVFTMIW